MEQQTIAINIVFNILDLVNHFIKKNIRLTSYSDLLNLYKLVRFKNMLDPFIEEISTKRLSTILKIKDVIEKRAHLYGLSKSTFKPMFSEIEQRHLVNVLQKLPKVSQGIAGLWYGTLSKNDKKLITFYFIYQLYHLQIKLILNTRHQPLSIDLLKQELTKLNQPYQHQSTPFKLYQSIVNQVVKKKLSDKLGKYNHYILSKGIHNVGTRLDPIWYDADNRYFIENKNIGYDGAYKMYYDKSKKYYSYKTTPPPSLSRPPSSNSNYTRPPSSSSSSSSNYTRPPSSSSNSNYTRPPPSSSSSSRPSSSSSNYTRPLPSSDYTNRTGSLDPNEYREFLRLLQLDQHSEPDFNTVKKNRNKILLKIHPDKTKNLSQIQRKQAQQKFKKVTSYFKRYEENL